MYANSGGAGGGSRLQARPPRVSAGRPQTTPAARGPRRPAQDPPTGPRTPGTPERRLAAPDAYPGAASDPWLPGEPADPPAWPWTPGECDRNGVLGRGCSFLTPLSPQNRDTCGVCSHWCLEATSPAPSALGCSRSLDPTRRGLGRLYLRTSCPPCPSWASRSLLEPSLGGMCPAPTQCPTMSCECPPGGS